MPMISIADRQSLGKLIADHYHKRKIKIPLFRAQVKEDETGETITVIAYPKMFKEEMDRLIHTYITYTLKNKEKFLKRKKIINREPVASYKPSNPQSNGKL